MQLGAKLGRKVSLPFLCPWQCCKGTGSGSEIPAPCPPTVAHPHECAASPNADLPPTRHELMPFAEQKPAIAPAPSPYWCGLILTNPFLLLGTCSSFPPSSSLSRAAFLLPSPPAASLFPFISPLPCEEACSWPPHFSPTYSQVCVAFTCCFLL